MQDNTQHILSINMSENVNVVYFHKRNDTNEVFYVGIGKTDRAYSKHNRSKSWKRVVYKVGFTAEVIHEELSWEEACELEKKYIKELGRRDLGLGVLVNHTDGGDGVENMIITDEHRKKTSETIKSKIDKGEWKPGMLGKKMPRESVLARAKQMSETYKPSEEHKKILSEKLKGEGNGMFGKKPWNYGIPTSEEQKQKLVDNHKGMTGLKHTTQTKSKQSESNKSRKLNAEDVIYIRENYKKGDEQFGAVPLSKKFGVQGQTIRGIAAGKSWKHLAD